MTNRPGDDDVAPFPHEDVAPFLDERGTPGRIPGSPHPREPGAPLRERRTVTVEGRARHVNQRTAGFGQNATQVLTFRVDDADGAGNLRRSVSVEVRGIDIAGRIGEGEAVRVVGVVRGGLVKARRVTNLHTMSQVSASRWNALQVVGAVLAVLFCAGFAMAAVNMYHRFTDLPRQFGDPAAAGPTYASVAPVTKTITIDNGGFGVQFDPENVDLLVGDSAVIHNDRSQPCTFHVLNGDLPNGPVTVAARSQVRLTFTQQDMLSVQCKGIDGPPLTISVEPR